MKESVIREKSYAFALRIVNLAGWLREKRHYELAAQVLRAGTGIGANVEEALAGFSRADFIAKMGIASKEARETHYWLRLLRDSEIVTLEKIGPLIDDCLEQVRTLTAIVKTGQSKNLNSKLKIKN